MPVDTQPEDKPAAVCFHFNSQENGLFVTCSLVEGAEKPPFAIEGGTPHFSSHEDFKAKALSAGMSPAVAEDQRRSFNATARQLRELGFTVHLNEEKKAA